MSWYYKHLTFLLMYFPIIDIYRHCTTNSPFFSLRKTPSPKLHGKEGPSGSAALWISTCKCLCERHKKLISANCPGKNRWQKQGGFIFRGSKRVRISEFKKSEILTYDVLVLIRALNVRHTVVEKMGRWQWGTNIFSKWRWTLKSPPWWPQGPSNSNIR